MPISTVGIIAAQRQVGGGGGITKEFLQSVVDTADLTTYTFSAQPIGTASATRRVVVSVERRLNRAISSASIGGVTASIDADASDPSNRMSIISAVVPTGTTADVVITFSSGAINCGIGMWRLSDGAPTGQIATSASTQPANLDVTTAVGDIVIAAGGVNSSGTTFTWSGADERFDEVVQSLVCHTGADVIASGALTSITLTPSTGTTTLAACAVAYA